MKYFLMIAVLLFAGCRVPYPSVGVGAPNWKQKCVTERHCDNTGDCRIVRTCYQR